MKILAIFCIMCLYALPLTAQPQVADTVVRIVLTPHGLSTSITGYHAGGYITAYFHTYRPLHAATYRSPATRLHRPPAYTFLPCRPIITTPRLIIRPVRLEPILVDVWDSEGAE